MSRHSSAHVLGLAVAAALALAACKGQGGNDTLADGATDSNSAATGATSAGPGAPPVDSASPAAGNDASQATTPTTGGAASPTLMLSASGPHGTYVTNGAGNALYWVEGDTDGSKCTGACTQAWPPVTVDMQQPTGAPGLQGASISTVARADGMRQATFEGHPLYRYAADTGANQANGDGVKDKYGSWHVAKPSPAPASGATTPASAPPAGDSKKG